MTYIPEESKVVCQVSDRRETPIEGRQRGKDLRCLRVVCPASSWMLSRPEQGGIPQGGIIMASTVVRVAASEKRVTRIKSLCARIISTAIRIIPLRHMPHDFFKTSHGT